MVTISIQCFDIVASATGRTLGLQKVGCLYVVGDNLTGAFSCHVALVITTTAVIHSSNKIRNGDILVTANPGPPGKMAVKMERELEVT